MEKHHNQIKLQNKTIRIATIELNNVTFSLKAFTESSFYFGVNENC